jgi:MFS family permease
MLGSRTTTIAYPVLVLHLSCSPLAAGLAVSAATAPSILVYMPAGALVDRWDARRTMLVSEPGRGDTAIAMATVTLALGRFSMPWLILTSVAEQTSRTYLASGVSGDGMLPACRRVDAPS